MNTETLDLAQTLEKGLQNLSDVALQTGDGYEISMSLIMSVINFSSVAVAPIAMSIVAIFLFQQMFEMQDQLGQSGMNGPQSSIRLIGWTFFKMAIAYIIVTKMPEFLVIIIEMGETLVEKVLNTNMGSIGGLDVPSVEEIAEDICKGLGHKVKDHAQNGFKDCDSNVFTMMWTSTLIFISSLACGLATIAVDIVQFSRIIAICTLAALSPIPCATLLSKEHSHIGKSFIRSFVATILISAVLVITLKVFGLIANHFSPEEVSADGWAWHILKLSSIQITAILGAGAMAKKLVSAV